MDIRKFGIAATGACMALTGSALAQPTRGVEEVVVTARKREETLLSVPISITAITSQEIEARAVTNLKDVAQYTPSLTIVSIGAERDERYFQIPVIRGMNPNGGQTNVGVFINGAPNTLGFVEGIGDLERVEVLRGPQNAYFGRSTFGGAINIVTKNPGDTWKGSVAGLYGSSNWSDFLASVEGPIVPGKLAFRASGHGYSMTGQYRNVWDGSRLGDQSSKSVSGNLFATPSENFTAKLFVTYFHNDDGPQPSAKYDAVDYNCNAGASATGAKNYVCGKLPNLPVTPLGVNFPIDQSYVTNVLQNGRGLFNPAFVPFLDHGGAGLKAWHGDLTLTYTLPGSGISLTSLTGYNHMKNMAIANSELEDASGFANPLYVPGRGNYPYPTYLFVVQNRSEDISEELRITSDQKQRLRGMLGGSYYKVTQAADVYGAVPTGLAQFSFPSPTKTRTLGVFASLAYDITDQLTATAEGRYQSDRIRAYSGVASPYALQATGTFTGFTPRINVQYRFSQDLLAYATYSQGLNPGAFNVLQVTPLQTAAAIAYALAQSGTGTSVKQEKLYNYELGLKGKYLDGRGSFTLAAYYDQWKNQIVRDYVSIPAAINNNFTSIIQPLTNIGLTNFYGIEVETALQITPELRGNLSFGYSPSDIRNYKCAICFTNLNGKLNIVGTELPNVADYNGVVGLEYRTQLTGDYEWYAKGDLIFRSGLWDTVANIVRTQSSRRANFRLGLDDKRVMVEVFVLNAFQDRAVTSIQQGSDLLRGGVNALFAGEPLLRQFGIRASYKY